MKKVNFKKAVSIVLSFALFMSISMPAFAGDISDTPYDGELDAYIPVHASEGEAVVFQSVGDEELTPAIRPFGAGDIIFTQTNHYPPSGSKTDTVKEVNRYRLTSEFVKYLTTSWAYASSYQWSQSNTATWTFSGNVAVEIHEKVRVTLGLQKSQTTYYGVSITINADPGKLSKLGFSSDFDVLNYSCTTRIYDASLGIDNTTYSTGQTKTPSVNSYLIPYYL